MKKNYIFYGSFVVVTIIGLLGWSLAFTGSRSASAQEGGEAVDGALLDSLYDAVFHRPADAGGRGFHLGRSVRDVLRDFRNAPEQRYYGALFKAVKAYEEAQRAPGELSDTEKQSHLDLIDSALSSLLAWVDTLPSQDPCDAIIGPDVARQAIKDAYDRLNSTARGRAEFGLLNAARRIGPPETLPIHDQCDQPVETVTSTPTPTPTPTATATATVAPSPTVTVTPTPTTQ